MNNTEKQEDSKALGDGNTQRKRRERLLYVAVVWEDLIMD